MYYSHMAVSPSPEYISFTAAKRNPFHSGKQFLPSIHPP